MLARGHAISTLIFGVCQTRMAVVDNFEQIKSLLNFSDEAALYYVQIFMRRKDIPSLPTHCKKATFVLHPFHARLGTMQIEYHRRM